MTDKQRQDLLDHLQTAVEIELATIPVYLYTYYSINRDPSNCDNVKVDGKDIGQELVTFANKAGGIIMSVAIEEMLHLSLACNLLKSLGGQPKIYGKSPWPYPTNLPHHKAGFSVGLEKLSESQLKKFMQIELPEETGAPPEGDNWETIGQFYDYIAEKIEEWTTDADFRKERYQLEPKQGYYADSNVDTVYPKDGYYIRQPINPLDPVAKGADQAVYPNDEDSGDLIVVRNKAAALKAIEEIKHQGEGYPGKAYDDASHDEKSHYAKYRELLHGLQRIPDSAQSCFIYNFPTNPTKDTIPAVYHPFVDLVNAVFSYLMLMTEVAFTLKGPAQHSLFYIGMHKGMIFILDKIIGAMHYQTYGNGIVLSPTFENYKFASLASAKQELIDLYHAVPTAFNVGEQILDRIKDLPDVNVPEDGRVRFA